MQINFVPTEGVDTSKLKLGELYHLYKKGIIVTLEFKSLPNGKEAFRKPDDLYDQEGFWYINEFEMIEDLWE